MSALWGSPKNAARPLQAHCEECAWKGTEHWEPDSDAVMLAASDAHAHDMAAHAEVPEGTLF